MGRERGEVGQRNNLDDIGRVRINTTVTACGEEEWGSDGNMCDVIGMMRRRHSITRGTHGDERFSGWG
jgi:hypothetical protein